MYSVEILGRYRASVESPDNKTTEWLVHEALQRKDVSLVRIINPDKSHCVYAFENGSWVKTGTIK